MLLWEIAEYAGETLVFIGVVGEVFADWTEHERKKLAKFSSVLLVIGLAVSLAALIGTNEQFNGTITDLQTVVSDAKRHALDAAGDADRAKTAANGAVISSDTALQTVGSIKGEVDSAKTTADVAKGEVDGAKRDADAVRKEVKEARTEMDIVESFVSSRHIVDPRPFDKLKPFKKKRLVLISIEGDEEAREFCFALADKLSKVVAWRASTPAIPSGVDWPLAECGAAVGGNAAGVSVSGSDKEFVQAVANAIRDATGVPVATPPDARVPENIEIIVGAKLPGIFHK